MRYTTLILVLFINTLCYAQNDTLVSENSLLWEISGQDLEKPSYIFGTIHLIPEEDYFFSDDMEISFSKCKTLALEIDMDIPIITQLKLAKMAMIPEGKSLSDYLSPEDYQSFSSYILDSLQIKKSKFNQINMIKPIFSTSLILVDLLPKTKTYENELSKMAKKNGMEIKGLETAEYQMNIMNKVSMEEQIEMLLKDGFSGNPLDEYMELVEIYKDQDINEMLHLSQEEDFMINYEDDLLSNRNRNWVPIIEEMIKNNSTFIAVGAMHLPGETGILNLLRKKGYSVKPVGER